MKRIGIFGIYFFLFVILLLSGLYFGKVFFILFFIYAAVPGLSFIHLMLIRFYLRYHQEFSSEHPLKGEEVIYKLSIKNESIFMSTPILFRFRVALPRFGGETDRSIVILKSGEIYSKERVINCPVRGVYTVGLESLIVTDFFGFFRFRLPVWHRTFYVYPRLLSVVPTRFLNESTGAEIVGSATGELDDVTLFRTLTEYQRGESIQHIAWKKFAALGEPFLKEYDTTSQPGVSIYLDTRRIGPLSTNTLISEDCSIEVLVALVKYFISTGICVYVNAAGWEDFYFDGYDEDKFLVFHRRTIQLRFESISSPVRLLEADRYDSRFNPSLVIFITHIPDPEIITLLEDGGRKEIASAAVFNFSALKEHEAQKIMVTLDAIKEREGNCIPVWDAETIKEDLMS